MTFIFARFSSFEEILELCKHLTKNNKTLKGCFLFAYFPGIIHPQTQLL